MSLFFCLKIVAEYERAVIFRLGRMIGAKGPGLFFVLPCMDEIQRVDLRTVSFDIPPQEILTKDSVTVKYRKLMAVQCFFQKKILKKKFRITFHSSKNDFSHFTESQLTLLFTTECGIPCPR